MPPHFLKKKNWKQMETMRLPIYEATLDLVQEVLKVKRNMQRHFKQDVGLEMAQQSIRMLSYIFRANRKDWDARLEALDDYLDAYGMLKSIVRICTVGHIISAREAARLSVAMRMVDKQAHGWRQSTEKKIEKRDKKEKEETKDAIKLAKAIR